MVNITVNYCCKRKMLQETRTEETMGSFCNIFVIDGILIGGGAVCRAVWF